MRSYKPPVYWEKLFSLILSFSFAITIIAQNSTKPTTAKTFTVKKLKVSFQLDTTGNSSFYVDDNMAAIVFTKDYYIQYFVYDEASTLNELRSGFRSDEFIQTLDGKNELKQFSDSSVVKINGVVFWKTRQSWRPIPRYWVEMRDKKKLSSQQMTEYLQSDKESWNKSSNAIVYYGTHPKTKKMFLIQGGFRNGGELPPTFETVLKQFVSSIKYL